jgi:hypothetical protein
MRHRAGPKKLLSRRFVRSMNWSDSTMSVSDVFTHNEPTACFTESSQRTPSYHGVNIGAVGASR